MPNEPPGAQPCELATQDITAGPGRQLQRQGAHADLRSSRISRPVEETLLLGRLEEHIRKARKELRALAEGRKDIVQLGGMEAIASKINLAALRRDSTGKLDSAGYARFTEAGSKAVDRTIQLCLNSVVVSGLILSIGFAIAFSDIVASDETIEFFGGSNASSTIVSTLYTLHDTCIILAISSNLALLLMSMNVLVLLLAWIPQLDAQLCWLIENTESVMYIQAILPFILVFAMAILAVPAGFLRSPMRGFISLLLPASVTCATLWAIRIQTYVRSMQLVQARQLFGMKTDDIPRRVFDDAILVKRRKAERRRTRVQCE